MQLIRDSMGSDRWFWRVSVFAWIEIKTRFGRQGVMRIGGTRWKRVAMMRKHGTCVVRFFFSQKLSLDDQAVADITKLCDETCDEMKEVLDGKFERSPVEGSDG